MNNIPLEINERVVYFLSSREKKKLREVNRIFKSIVKPIVLKICKIEEQLSSVYGLVNKKHSELTCYKWYNNISIYVMKRENEIHRLFTLSRYNDKCIDDDCREKRLGYIYVCYKERNEKYFLNNNIYNRRKVPYCNSCFNKYN